MIVCEECGSDKVQTVTWVEINSQKVHDSALSESADAQDNWCPNCTANVHVTDVNVYNDKLLRDKAEDIIIDELYIVYPKHPENDTHVMVCKAVIDVRGYDDFVFQEENGLIYRLPNIKDFKLKTPNSTRKCHLCDTPLINKYCENTDCAEHKKDEQTPLTILENMLQWSDRLGSDEIIEINNAIKLLKNDSK